MKCALNPIRECEYSCNICAIYFIIISHRQVTFPHLTVTLHQLTWLFTSFYSRQSLATTLISIFMRSILSIPHRSEIIRQIFASLFHLIINAITRDENFTHTVPEECPSQMIGFCLCMTEEHPSVCELAFIHHRLMDTEVFFLFLTVC